MQRSKNDVWVGLFVLIGAAAILFLALQSANLLFDSTNLRIVVDANRNGVIDGGETTYTDGSSLAAWNPSRLTTSLSRPRWQ